MYKTNTKTKEFYKNEDEYKIIYRDFKARKLYMFLIFSLN